MAGPTGGASIKENSMENSYRVAGIDVMSRFSTVQPPFEAASRSNIETDLSMAKLRLLSRAKRPPERRLQPRLAPHAAILACEAPIVNRRQWIVSSIGTAAQLGGQAIEGARQA